MMKQNWFVEARSNEILTEERWLAEFEEGFLRFQQGRKTGKPHRPKTAKMAPSNEKSDPETIVLSCSDCSFTPEDIFDRQFGSLYVVTNLGNRVATDSINQIRRALSKSSYNHILVLGHEQCSAVDKMVHFQLGSDCSEELKTYLRKAGDEIRLIAPVKSQKNFGSTWVEKNVIAGVEQLKELGISESCQIGGIVVDLGSPNSSFRSYV